MNTQAQIKRRRTFGIISHPDAGKTTLTEKLLLFGGAIQTAGAVKAKKSNQHATSDFMEIEKQRGISVATSVMGFEYKDYHVTILDTPGHKDFCEDTYRTLTAVDSCIMVIDSVKGVESQTYKLLEVCRMRHTPIMTFINKVDRDGMEPIEVCDNIEDKLSLPVCPITWPIGSGKLFKGIYHFIKGTVILMSAHGKETTAELAISDPKLAEILETWELAKLKEDIELIKGVYPEFSVQDYLDAKITPVFFGSALNNFGIQSLLDHFCTHAPYPLPRPTTEGEISPFDSKFSGFVFKIHANIDPKHRDRIAFLRVCSGVFERQSKYHHVRLNKSIKSHNPTAFMAQEKSIIDIAYPGDIVGLHDTGNFQIGDTLTDSGSFYYTGIPNFSPEIFKIVVNKDPMKSKQLHKGLAHLSEEGVVQLFYREYDNQHILGVVGPLQFEVIQYRLASEYGATCIFNPLDFKKATWIDAKDSKVLKAFIESHRTQIAHDKEKRSVFLSETDWSLQREIKENPEIEFEFSSERLVV